MKRIITCLSMLCMLVGLAMASPGPKALAASAETTLYGGISTGMKPVGIYSTTTATPPTLTPLASISSVTPSAGVYIDGYYQPEFGISDSRFSCYVGFPTDAYYIYLPNNMDGKMQNCKVQIKFTLEQRAVRQHSLCNSQC